VASTDGTVGFVEFSEMTLTFDESLTKRMNEDFNGDVATAFTELQNVVKRKGFVERGADDDDDDDDDDDGGSGGSTGTPSGGGDGTGS
jgi:hypothetical protein